MKLWEYLKKKMAPYASRVALGGSGITYKDLLRLNERGNCHGKLNIVEGSTRERLALEILKCIAAGNVTVPVSKEYGESRYETIRKTVEGEKGDFNDLAFMMFTSGTTGIPKGVMLTHENIAANLEYIAGYFDLSGLSRICIVRPLIHISSLTGEFLYALCSGLTIYFYEEAFVPQRLRKFLSEKEIEVLCATPTLYLALARCAENTFRERYEELQKQNFGELTPMRCLSLSYRARKETFPVKVGALSGERLTKSAAKKLAESFPFTQFYNVYGLTEHSPRVCALTPENFLRKAGSVGKPIGQVSVEIENGELLVKSPCVMKGYFKERERTEEKLKGGWLHTGDAAHTDEEGYYYIDGRKDDMIIRAGLNVFPEEIEESVKTCTGVEDCVAYGRTTEEGITEIGLKYTGGCEPAELKKQLVKKLDAHILPSVIERVEMLDRTVSGKKVRK